MSKESKLVTQCLKLLEIEFKLKTVKWFGRLQSGDVMVKKSYKSKKTGLEKTFVSMMRGCKKGTSDLFFIDCNGFTWWVEVKTSKGKQSKEQIEFMELIDSIPNHNYSVVRTLTEMQFVIDNSKRKKGV